MAFFQSLWKHRWATMIELMGVLAIMGLGIAALLDTIGWGIYFAKDTENNIKAINLAREWIEWMTNIRDTNWMRFSSDRWNCWKTKDYNGLCINDTSFAWIIGDWSYILYIRNGAWYLSGISTTPYTTNWTAYSKAFKVSLDDTGFWTQTGITTTTLCNSQTQTGCLSPFTREITVKLVGTGTINIQSIVRWQGKRMRNVTLETVLTNWKSNF